MLFFNHQFAQQNVQQVWHIVGFGVKFALFAYVHK